jgi:hypothetical protein
VNEGVGGPFTLHCSLFTLLLHLRVPGRQADATRHLTIDADLERILAWAGQGDVEDQHSTCLDVHYPSRWLTKLDGAFSAQKLGAGVIYETNTNRVNADLGSPTAHPQHEMGARIDRGEVGEPDVLKHPEHAELPLLVDQGVVGDDREIEVQGSGNSD